MTMARQVIINIDDDDLKADDIAEELRDVAHSIEMYDSRGGMTALGNTWSIEEDN